MALPLNLIGFETRRVKKLLAKWIQTQSFIDNKQLTTLFLLFQYFAMEKNSVPSFPYRRKQTNAR